MKEFKKILSLKLSEYENLFNTEDDYYGKDFKSNCKFINSTVKRMLKNKETEDYILSFLDDCIKYHKNTYYIMSLSQKEYFEVINQKYKI
jgi:hypothetical protein